MMGRHSESIAIWGEAMERSGEEGFPEVGRRVGWSVLSRTRSESVNESWIESPLLAAEESEVEEYQEGWWALKSPKMRVSSWAWKSGSRAGAKPGGRRRDVDIEDVYFVFVDESCDGEVFSGDIVGEQVVRR